MNTLLDEIGLRFVSGNSVPVERATMTRAEYDQLRALLSAQEGSDNIDVEVMESGTVSVDVVLASTNRVFSVLAMKDGSVGYAAYIDGDRYHGKIDAEAFGAKMRERLEEAARELAKQEAK